MSIAVSITQDGTVLNTAGKYVDQDIVVGISDSIKLPEQTFNPSTVDQTIPAGKYLSGAQTIKAVSGAKSITENGTYDVTEYASASVNVPSKRIRVEFTLATAATAPVTVISGDADIAAHYDDDNAKAIYQALTPVNGRFFGYQGNRNFNEPSGTAHYGVYCTNAATISNTKLSNSGTSAKAIVATANGDLIIIATSSNPLSAGTYIVEFMW